VVVEDKRAGQRRAGDPRTRCRVGPRLGACRSTSTGSRSRAAPGSATTPRTGRWTSCSTHWPRPWMPTAWPGRPSPRPGQEECGAADLLDLAAAAMQDGVVHRGLLHPLHQRVRAHLGREVGHDPAGLDDVAPDVPVGVDVRGRPGESFKRPLRGRVASADVAGDADPMFMIEPPPESFSNGAEVWMPRRVPVTLISKILLNSPISTSGNLTSAFDPTMSSAPAVHRPGRPRVRRSPVQQDRH
jgi:hypothetical protein